MKLIKIDSSNIDSQHICCAIGTDKANLARAAEKREWMKKCFKDGLVFKRFDERGKLFIEYMPIESVWKPLIGKNFFVINCLWVAGKFAGKGLARDLLNTCIDDARKQKKSGVCVVTSNKKKPYLTDKKFYINSGFEVCDTAYPYFELLSLKISKDGQLPKFTKNAKQGIYKNKKDFSFVYSNQCPFTKEYAEIMSEVVKKRDNTFEIIELNKCKDAQKLGSPSGSFGVYYKGKFVDHEVMPEKKFVKLLDKIL